jgi:glutamate-1-semialdehyde aminotransferase
MFRFAPLEGSALFPPLNVELLHYHLIASGVYVWEGRLCFLSTSHTDDDLRRVIRAAQHATDALRDADFF